MDFVLTPLQNAISCFGYKVVGRKLRFRQPRIFQSQHIKIKLPSVGLHGTATGWNKQSVGHKIINMSWISLGAMWTLLGIFSLYNSTAGLAVLDEPKWPFYDLKISRNTIFYCIKVSLKNRWIAQAWLKAAIYRYTFGVLDSSIKVRWPLQL